MALSLTPDALSHSWSMSKKTLPLLGTATTDSPQHFQILGIVDFMVSGLGLRV